MKTTHARVGGWISAALVAALLAIASGDVLAQGAGGGVGGGGGGAGQGGGGQGGGGQGGSGETPDLGDMIVLYRDASGVPIPSASEQVLDPETNTLVDGGRCLQPLAGPGVTVVNILDQTVACTPASPTESCLIPVDPLSCSIVVGYESYAQAVDFARMNVARAPATVIDRQLADLLVNLSSAQCLKLDPAGRILMVGPDTLDADGDGDTTEIVAKAVDSSLQNLAIYREMMSKGYLGAATSPIALPTPFAGYNFIDRAAKGLGAASDKGGKIDVDVVAYLNQILGLSNETTPTALPKICQTYRQEVQGVMQPVTKCFLCYGESCQITDGTTIITNPYGYQRSDTYSNLPFPAYIPAGEPTSGVFEYLTLYPDATVPTTGAPLFWITNGLIANVVFAGAPGFTGGDIGGFAQASDDARAVIDFVHSHPVLVGYETGVTCEGPVPPPEPVVKFDVSLSTLQMPIRMVGGTAREGTVAVTNEKGPNAASGIVTVIGKDGSGTLLYEFPPFTFTGLAAGASQSWTITFTGPSYATTITWTATAIATGDVNLANNILTATTTVQKPRGKTGSGEGE